GLRQWLVGAEYVPTTEAAPLERLVAEVEAARYAPPGGQGGDPARLRADVREVAELVADQLPARRRRLARLFPASGVAAVTRAAAVAGGSRIRPHDRGGAARAAGRGGRGRPLRAARWSGRGPGTAACGRAGGGGARGRPATGPATSARPAVPGVGGRRGDGGR